MARKITEQLVSAFINDRDATSGNTSSYQGSVTIAGERRPGRILALHGNAIAFTPEGTQEVWISDGGWQSITTKERLNGLPGVQVWQHDYCWNVKSPLFESSDWDGSWVRVR